MNFRLKKDWTLGFKRICRKSTEVTNGLRVSDSWRSIGDVDVLMLCHDVNRALGLDGKAYSQILDPIRERFENEGFKVATIAHRWSTLSGNKAFGSPVTYNRAAFTYILADRVRSISRLRGLGSRTFAGSEHFWFELLRTCDPRLIVLLGAPPEVCSAAKHLGKIVVEPLHGFGYRKVPWGYDDLPDEWLPSIFIAFDDLSYSTFCDVFGTDRVFRARRDNLPVELREATQGDFQVSINVLVTLGWKTETGNKLVDITPKEMVTPELVDAVQLSARSIRWYFRPHPVVMRSHAFRHHRRQLSEFLHGNDNCHSVEQSSGSLDALLEDVHCHVTMFSETAYEASFRGISTLFLSPALMPGGCLEGTFKDLVDSGHAEIQPDFTGQQIVDWIQRQASTRRQAPVITDHQRASDVVMDIFGRAKPGRL